MKKILLILAISAAALYSGCSLRPVDREYPDLKYSGDGEFHDAGRQAGIHRFALDLGAVDLNSPSESSYDLVGLPETPFVCYVRVDYPLPITGQPERDLPWGQNLLKITVADESGNEVFSEEAAVSKWVWSGTVGASRTDLYTRNTRFTPAPGTSYRLTMEVRPTDAEAPGGQLLLMGGGWKLERQPNPG